MSRIGKNPIKIPQGVEIQISGQNVKVKGKLGELTLAVHDDVSVAFEDKDGAKVLRLKPKTKSPMALKIWPTMCVHIRNMIVGVTNGYSKKLAIQGVGYRANMQGQALVLSLGFSHEVRFNVPKGIQVKAIDQTNLEVSGIDKQMVGQVAANIRGFKPPEPYKGKGIRYTDEYVLRKEGKKK